jgi:hypothetical protein
MSKAPSVVGSNAGVLRLSAGAAPTRSAAWRVRHLAAASIALLLVAGSAAGSAAAAPQANQEDFIAVQGPVIAIVGARVIDGTGAAPRVNQTVIIRDGRIAEVGDSGSVRPPDGAEIVDAAGHTLIPGLIGLHNHSYYTAAGGRAAQLSTTGPIIYLASGVTTIRTTGARAPYEELNLKAAIDAAR